MEKTTKKLINSIFEEWKKGKNIECYGLDYFKRSRKYFLLNLSKIFDLNSKIEIEDIKNKDPKPSFFKKIYQDYNFIYIILSKNGFLYSYSYNEKMNPERINIDIDSYPYESEAKIRKEAVKIYLFKQDYNFIKKVYEKKHTRFLNRSNNNILNERYYIKKDFFNDYSIPEEKQRYKLINSRDSKRVLESNLIRSRIDEYIDKSGYEKQFFSNNLEKRLRQYKIEKSKKEFNNYKNFDNDFKYLNNEIEKIKNDSLKINMLSILNNKILFEKYANYINYYFETKEKIEKLKSSYGSFNDIELYQDKINDIKKRFLDFENYILNSIIKTENQYFKWDDLKVDKFWFDGKREIERAKENSILIKYLKDKNINLEKLNQLNKISYELIKEDLC